MYTVKIRDHIMIAHSLGNDGYFGPAQNLHGATYVVDASFYSPKVNDHNIVVDIAKAHEVLKEVLQSLNYQNLDEVDGLKNQITTTEFMAKYIHDEVKSKIEPWFKGKIKVTLGESHVAWASYESE